MPTKRDSYGEHDNRTPGDRRRGLVIAPNDCDKRLVDAQVEIAVLKAELRNHREYTQQALDIAKSHLESKIHELNDLRKQYEQSIKELFTKAEHSFFEKEIKNRLKGMDETISRNSSRLDKIENEKSTNENIITTERNRTLKYVVIIGLIFTALEFFLKFIPFGIK
jgi:Mg2+ and Co2+ transporter CorA